MVMVEVDNKVPMYLQTGGAPFYYVAQTEDYPRSGDTASLMAWLDRASGKHWDPQRTIIVAHYRHGETPPFGYLDSDHQVVTTQPSRGEQWLHARDDQSVAYIPNA